MDFSSNCKFARNLQKTIFAKTTFLSKRPKNNDFSFFFLPE